MAESQEKAQRIIAIAIDESVHSDNAFQWYCDHIRKDGDFLLLIHVPEKYDFTMASPGIVAEMLREIKHRVANLEKKYRENLSAKGINGKFRSEAGKAGEKIVAIAKEEKATLIITGTRGLGKLRRTILGSVSSYIVHHSCVPVLINEKFRSEAGKAGEKIVAIAKEEKATLIITGTRGLGKLRRTILGSVSSYIVHHSCVPVLVCRWKNNNALLSESM